MSSARLRATDLSRELEAALLGDFPRLEAGSAEAERFAQAFGPQAGESWWEHREPKEPLGRAAAAVSHERRGEGEDALVTYRSLARARDPWVRLLGLLLQGWSSAVIETAPIHQASERIGELRSSARKARLLAKLAGFAADKGEREFSKVLWQEAIAASDPQTHLGRALRIEAVNLGLPVSGVRFKRPRGETSDPLVFPEQIEALQLQSAIAATVQEVEERIGGPWQETFRFGNSPLAALDSAEAQARWIGVPWLRRPIQKQLGAQLLAGGALGSGQWAHGVLDWTLGGGSHYQLALRYAEPHFDHEAADRILAAASDCDPTRGRDQRLASLAAEAWDLLSEDGLRRVVAEIPPQLGEASPASESRLVWAAYAIRLTDEWYAHYRQFAPELQAALLETLDPVAIRHFDRAMKETMYRALGDDARLLGDGGRLLPFAAALAPGTEQGRLRRLIEDPSPKYAWVVGRLLLDRPELVSAAAQARTLTSLVDSLEEQSEKARHGTTMLGGPGPRMELGRFLSVSEKPDRPATELLVTTAIDPTLPSPYLREARQGLVLVRRAGRLRASDLRTLRTAAESEPLAPHPEAASRAVLRALLLLICAEGTRPAERAELAALIRSPEERARSIAAHACAEALFHTQDEGLAWALVSGLFDPSPAVCEAALAGLPALDREFPAAAEVAWQRLPALFGASTRGVRIEIVHALNATAPKKSSQRRRRTELLTRAEVDRSWRVRDASTQSGGRRRPR
jgi:hypothetical protein